MNQFNTESQISGNENYNNPQFNNGQHNLPNATAVLILGILSIVGCFCYGIIGIICGIIAIILANKDKKLYNLNPNLYTINSLKNLNAGKICAYIGLAISIIYLICFIIVFMYFGYEIISNPNAIIEQYNLENY